MFETWSSYNFSFALCLSWQTDFYRNIPIGKQDGVKEKALKPDIYDAEKLKKVSKTGTYQNLVKNKIAQAQKASSQIGNMYAASIFMSLISDLWYKQKQLNSGDKLGFIAYGCGSKAKVFEGELVENFNDQISSLDLIKY